MTPAQSKALHKFTIGETDSAFGKQCRLPTLWALVRLGYLKNVTQRGPGSMFSPTTHYKFKRVL